MLKTIARLWNTVFARKEWAAYGDPKTQRWVMRRWRNGGWEYREPTAGEALDAQWWQANAP